MSASATESSTLTLPFDKFWEWLQAHHNCIVRAGTPDVLLFDQEEYHWHLAQEDDTTLLVQVVRGKDLISEMLLMYQEIAYVQLQSNDAEEFVFECIVETPHARDVAYHFIMAHSYDDESPLSRRWTH